MCRKQGFFTIPLILIIAIIALNSDVLSVKADTASVIAIKSWTDTFNSPTLDSRWSWIREDSTHWSLTSRPGFLQIITQAGGLIGQGGDVKNLLLTKAPQGNYQITSQVTITPTENFQGAGIFIYQDDDNYILIARRYGNMHQVTLRQEVNGIQSSYSNGVTDTTVTLRIIRDGDTYTGRYSLDGVTWNSLGQLSLSFSNPKIGLGSQNGPSLKEIPSNYDFFQLDDYTNYQYLPFLTRD